jgi:hypothetical protein
MGKLKYGYGWLLKFVLAAILIGVGLFMYIENSIVYIITGIVIVIFSLFRVVPLMKSLNKEALRTLNLIEIIFDFIVGGLMIYIAISQKDNLDNVIWSSVYRYSLAFFFYARGLVYFNSVVFFGEKSEVPKFWIHILSISLGAIIAVYPNFGVEAVGLILLLISLIGSAYLGYDGFGGYKKYREYQKEINAQKEKEKAKEVEKEIPAPILDKEEEKRPYVN